MLGKKQLLHPIPPGRIRFPLLHFTFTKIRSDEKWSIDTIYGLEMLDSDFPPLIKSQTVYGI